jgi:hypothetical protein
MYFTEKRIKYQDNLNGTYTLLKPIVLETNDWHVITVPAGYTCDVSSIPRFLWHIVGYPTHPLNIRAGFVHDYEYGLGRLSRKDCDKLFYQILRLEGKSWFIAQHMYHAVRAFGGSHYG